MDINSLVSFSGSLSHAVASLSANKKISYFCFKTSAYSNVLTNRFWLLENTPDARCLKITEKVSFNIASGASYVYILSGQKLIKNAKKCLFWRVFENLKLAVKQCYQTGQL